VPESLSQSARRQLQGSLRALQRPELVPYARFDISGTERIPREGPVIVVINHRSYFDGTALSLALARVPRTFRFLGKREVFQPAPVGALMRFYGGIPVDRGTGSDEPLEEAIAALRAGGAVWLAPQGTIPRGPAFFDPELKGRWGAARLAHATRAPVFPVGLWGTERVWPRNARLPRVNLVSPPQVTVRVGPEVALGYDDLDADTKRIMRAIAAQLPVEAKVRREPTQEELARTYPPGYRGDPAREATRRPGRDI
jgi:putative phosphoserine phosphatase/1-acylglycerol-3-phosphate O-acyltransferase